MHIEKDFVYYPVYIATLNRYNHFKRLVDSLSRCTDADKTELVIGLDYPPSEKYMEGYLKIKEYIPSITGFRKVTLFTTDVNLGQGKNSIRMADYIRNLGYDAFITLEDDNEVSPSFFRYMNAALIKYRDDDRIINVCAHSGREFEGGWSKNIYCSIDVPGYGFGVWYNKEDLIIKGPEYYYSYLKESLKRDLKLYMLYPGVTYQLVKMVERGVNYGDVCRVMTNIINGSFSLCPSVSLTRNWGADGSGLHSGVVKGLEKQYISEDTDFVLDEIEIEGTKNMYRKLFYRNMPMNKIKFVLYFVYKFLYLLKFYYFGKMGTKGTNK